MIVVQVGVKTECKIYDYRSIEKKLNDVNKRVHTVHIGCKTTQSF
jgi:hypothetical protein